MSTSPGNDTQPSRSTAPVAHQRRSRAARSTPDTPLPFVHADAVEIVFWARYEECEAGRLAQEADHLFDTSYNWAA